MELIRHKLQTGLSIVEILKSVAAPGYSEHHTGRALDLGTPDDPPFETSFAETDAYEWLNKRADRSGWRLSYPKSNPHGIIFEPWHWFFYL